MVWGVNDLKMRMSRGYWILLTDLSLDTVN
jgi:hypothetical protein